MPTTPPQQDVRLEAKLKVSGEDAVATIKMTNVGSRAAAVTNTFGFSDLFLYFEIEGLHGERVEYPADSQFEIFSEPAYICLDPGGSMLLKVNLRRWYHVLGGTIERTQAVPEAGPFSFFLPPGEYRLKTVYDAPFSPGKSHRCPRLGQPVESDWVEFAITAQ